MKINFIEDKIIFSLPKKLFMESSKNNGIIILHREDFLKLWKNEPNPINKELNEGNPEIWKKDSKYKEAERGFSYGYKNPVPLGKMRPFIIPCQLRKLYHRFKASSSLPSKKIAS